jgi:hypothetical protein
MNYLPRLASNCSPPDLCLLRTPVNHWCPLLLFGLVLLIGRKFNGRLDMVVMPTILASWEVEIGVIGVLWCEANPGKKVQDLT